MLAQTLERTSLAAEPLEVRTRDAERTRQEILDAATVEFAALGMGGARMEAVAERAGVNKRLVYYYFDSKENLFLNVLEAAYANIRGAEAELHLGDLEPSIAVRRLVEFTWGYYLAHPEFLTLLNSENLHKAKHLKGSSQVRNVNSPLIHTLGDVLERGRKTGVFRGGVDALQLYISIASLAYFYLSNNATLSVGFQRDLRTPAALAERLSHITDVILGYLLRKD